MLVGHVVTILCKKPATLKADSVIVASAKGFDHGSGGRLQCTAAHMAFASVRVPCCLKFVAAVRCSPRPACSCQAGL